MHANEVSGAAVIALAACLLGACASNSPTEAALLLVDQLDEYQNAIGEKIQAEREFYIDIRNMLDEAATRQVWVEQATDTRNRIIALTDRAIVVEKGLQVSVLQEFLRQESILARERNEEESRRRAEIAESYRVSFESLAIKQRELSATRSKLLSLSEDREVAEVLFEHVQNAARLAIELEEEAREPDTDDE